MGRILKFIKRLYKELTLTIFFGFIAYIVIQVFVTAYHDYKTESASKVLAKDSKGIATAIIYDKAGKESGFFITKDDVIKKSKSRSLLKYLAESKLESKVLKKSPEELTLASIRNDLQLELRNELLKSNPSEGKISNIKTELDNIDLKLKLEEFINNNKRDLDLVLSRIALSKVLGYEDIKKELLQDDNTALIEYVIARNASYLWVLTNRDIKLYELPEAAEFYSKISHFMMLLKEKQFELTRKDIIKEGAELYRILLKPAESILDGKKSIIIIPDKFLLEFPFEALVTEDLDDKNVNFAKVPFFLKKATVRYAPSANVLISLGHKSKTKNRIKKELLGFANPVIKNETISDKTQKAIKSLDVPQLDKLIYSEKELADIVTLLPKNSYQVFTGVDANKSNLKNNLNSTDYRMIHFAMHGIINEKEPQFSGLFLSSEDASKEDNMLSLREIYDLKLNTELVVLSASETSPGKKISGKGIIGLTRGFMSAGASSVVSSLWRVEDKSTSELMFDFYKNMVTKNENKADALRNAKLKILNDRNYGAPYFWAGFILIGDSGQKNVEEREN